MHRRDLVVIGGSAGALQALRRLMEGLPPRTTSALLIAIHRSSQLPGALVATLERVARLPVEYATDGHEFRGGHVYVAPPDHHLLVSGVQLRVTRGPREHGFRPAVDPLFRTAAREHGPRVVGVILSGALDDGTQGLALVKRHGGVAIVQRADDADHRGMPESALAHVDVDHVLPATEIGPLLARLAAEPVAAVATTTDHDVADWIHGTDARGAAGRTPRAGAVDGAPLAGCQRHGAAAAVTSSGTHQERRSGAVISSR